MQLRYQTGLTGEQYVSEEAWCEATLDPCPNHPDGGCSFARHGVYERRTPAGTLIARWYCRESHQTFSLLHYRRGGFDALYPKRRADLGRPRRLPPQAAELLIALKTEHPTWSVRQVIADAISSGHLPDGVRLAHSTVHRLLRAEGLMSKPAAAGDGADRRRFAYRFAGQLWMSDVMHRPTVLDGRRHRKTYLIGFLDDATRVCPFAAFAPAENTVAFLPVFKQALIRRGTRSAPPFTRAHTILPGGGHLTHPVMWSST